MGNEQKTVRLRAMIIREYDADPANYGDSATPEEMAEIDRKGIDADPWLVADTDDYVVKVEVV